MSDTTPQDHDSAPAPMGHNLPQGDDLVTVLTEQNADLIARRDELLDALDRVPETIEDEDTNGKVADFVKQIGAAIKRTDDRRKTEKEPYLEGGRNVDGVFRKIADPLVKAKETLTKRMTAYQRVKAEEERRRRLEEEEAARREAAEAEARARAAEAEAQAETGHQASRQIDADSAAKQAEQASADAVKASRAAGAKAADMHRSRGDYGATSSLRTYWDFEIVNLNKIPLAKLRPHIPQNAIEQAIRSYIRAGGRDLGGDDVVRIFENTTAVVR